MIITSTLFFLYSSLCSSRARICMYLPPLNLCFYFGSFFSRLMFVDSVFSLWVEFDGFVVEFDGFWLILAVLRLLLMVWR